MKSVLLVLFLVVLPAYFAQQNDEVMDYVEEEAEFPGGAPQMHRWIAEHVIYPTACLKKRIQGRVYVEFIIEKNGEVSNVRIAKGVHELLDNEAIRVIQSMPTWKPAKNNGGVVRSRCRIPINFTMN